MFLALAVIPLAQWAVGQIMFVSDAILPALYTLGFALAIAASAKLARDHPAPWPDALMVALVAAALLSTGLALIQWLRVEILHVPLDFLPPGGRPFANLSQPNHLATLLALGLAGALYLFERHRIGPGVTTLLCAWLGVGLLMARSRTSWLFLLFLALWWFVCRRRVRLRGWAVVTGLSAFALGTLAWTTVNEWLLLSLPVATIAERADTGLRRQLWVAMIEAIGLSPWVGWGWNQVSVGHLAVAMEHGAGQRVFQNAHSIILDLPLWMGAPLALVVMACAGRWLVAQMRACADGLQWSLALAILAIGTHALTEYPLDYAYFLFTLGLLVGALEGRDREPHNLRAHVATFIAPWVVSLGMLFWIGVEYMKVEESARQVRMVLAGVGLEKVSFVPPPDVAVLDAPREYHRLWITRVRSDMPVEDLTWMRKVVFRNPSSPAMLQYALAAGLNGRPDDAERMLRAVCNVHPPRRCAEAREFWRAAQNEYSELKAIALP